MKTTTYHRSVCAALQFLSMLFLSGASVFAQEIDPDAGTDFGNVEQFMKKSIIFKVRNKPSATANLVINNVTLTGGNATEWNFDEIVNFTPYTIVPGAERSFKISFTPKATATGTQQFITLHFACTPQCDTDGTDGARVFFGTTVPAVSLNSMLVLDRSGSMKDLAYTNALSQPVKKIEALQVAAAEYFNLLRIRGTDKLGVIKYNNVAAEYIAFPYGGGPITSATTFPSQLDASATTDINLLKPDNSTAIGKGLQMGFEKLPAGSPPANHTNMVILLTDGLENESPDALAVVPQVNTPCSPPTANCTFDKKIKIYSIAFGPDADQQKLKDISTTSGVSAGYGYYYADTESTNSGLPLQAFFYKIWAQATGLTTVIDPTVNVSLTGIKPIEVLTANITTSDIAASFLVVDDPAMRKYYKLELFNPAGLAVVAGTNIGGNPVKIAQQFNFSIYDVYAPGKGADFVGTWKLVLTPNGKCDSSIFINDRRHPCFVPITFAASAKSNLVLDAFALASKDEPGAEITLIAKATEESLSLENNQVSVDVKGPHGTTYGPFALSDAGNNGDVIANDKIFMGKFVQTASKGSYQFTFHAKVKNNQGQSTTREEIRFVPLFSRLPLPPETRCIPCEWLWLIIVVSVLLLAWIVYRTRPR